MNLDKLRNQQNKLWVNVASSYCVLPDFVNLDNSPFFRLLPVYPLLRPFLGQSKRDWFRQYRDARSQAAVVMHDCRKPLPFPDASVDHLLCSHFLEHVYPHQARAILADFHRALVPGGTAHLIVPNLRVYIDDYLAGTANGESADTLIDGLLLTSQHRPSLRNRLLEFFGYEGFKHRWMYDQQSFTKRVREVGFQVREDNSSPSAFFRRDDGALSIHILAQK
jgi:predicted SAM-dependent methyltransferase